MGALIRWELKKILNHKAFWIALVLGLVVFAIRPFANSSLYETSGSVKGMKDVYRQYEGQVITEAVQARMRQDLDRYITAHPDSFSLNVTAEGEPEESSGYFPNEAATDYDGGVWVAFENLSNAMSLEDKQEFLRQARERLAAGTDETGKPFTAYQKRIYQDIVQAGVVEPVVHYTKGWSSFFENKPLSGMLTMFVPGMALLGLFGGETSTRMEAVFLTARARRRAVWAKLLAAGLVALGSAVLFFGLSFIQMASIWGLEGAMLPVSAVEYAYSYSTMPIHTAFALSVLSLALAAAACGAIVVWASAQFRNALLTLLVGGGILVGMALLSHNYPNLLGNWFDTLWYGFISRLLVILPSSTLMDTHFLSQRVADAGTLASILLLPAALTILLYFLSHRAFLRRLKV